MKTGTSTLTTHATPLNSPQNQVEYLEPNEKQSKKMNEKKRKIGTSSLTTHATPFNLCINIVPQRLQKQKQKHEA